MNGIFVLAEVPGALGEAIHAIQRRYDPKLANATNPHITLVGSSGAGPIVPGTSAATLREKLQPITDTTPPVTLQFGRPMRFMQTDIVVLPLDPHGPLRTLHERIARSGLPFQRARFYFSPHCTLNFYPQLTPEALRGLLAVRFDEPFTIDRLQLYQNNDPQPPRKLLELSLRGAPEG